MKFIAKTVIKLKVSYYRLFLSEINNLACKARINQPTLFCGKGRVRISENVQLGYFPSPHFYSGYSHIEARDSGAQIKIEAGCVINNNFTVIAYNSKITIGAKSLIGTNVEILSSDFHNISPDSRWDSNCIPPSADVTIGENVWIGNSSKILKGVNIGKGAVIAANSVVVKDVAPKTLVAGSPAKEVREI